MRRRRYRTVTRTPFTQIVGFLALVLMATVSGQQPAQQGGPRVGYVYPAGGQQGTTLRVVVGGQALDGVADVVMSGSGVRASVVGLDKPLNARQITELRDQIQALQPKATEPAVRQQVLTMRAQLGDTLRRNRNPGLSELVTIEVEIAPDAAPGARQLRLGTPTGLSSPLTFIVGQLPEARERDVKNSVADAELAVTLPVTVNGRLIPGDVDNVRQPLRQGTQYMPGDVDRYRFDARQGQHLVVSTTARALTPYLADAVPGWFQAVVTLYDSTGREVAFCDDYRFSPDPVLHYQVPADGEYTVEVRDAIYRGREDFVYRISIGELPFITSVFPLGGRSGQKTLVELTGWNLRTDRITIDASQPGVSSVSTRAGALESNRVPFAADTLPEQLEREPNSTTKDAQPIALGTIVNGRVAHTGDLDVFSIKGRKGEAVVAEVTARRLESPLDASLELTDASGRRLAFNDDREDKAAAWLTHHADPFVMVTLPADGTYFLRLRDVQRSGGAEYAYRLRVSAPRPDFELRVSPSSINAPGGANVPVTVTAIRRDGFDADIALALRDAGGLDLSGGMIPAGQATIRATITAPPVATREPLRIRLEGRAVVQGRSLTREAVAADDRMQAFAYHHLVPTDDLRLFVSGRGGTRVPMRVLGSQPLKLPAGGSIKVRASLPPLYQALENVRFELSGPPDGITLRDVSVRGTDATFVLQADASKVTIGLRGNLIVLVSGERLQPANAQNQTPAARRRVPAGALPAMGFEVTK